MQLPLIVLIFIFCTNAELIAQSSNSSLNGQFTIINIHLNLQHLWTEEIVFEGQIEKGEFEQWVYYNISNFVFLDVDDTSYLFFLEKKHYEALTRGAEIVIVREKIDPPGRRYIFNRFREGLGIPVVAIEAEKGKAFFKVLGENVGEDLLIRAVPDVNSWTAFKPTILVFNIILLALSAVPLGIAIYKLIQFARVDQCSLSISTICLFLNLIGDICFCDRLTGSENGVHPS